MVKEGRAPRLSLKTTEADLTQDLVKILSPMKVLIIFDGVEDNDSVLISFVATLLERSNTSRVLLTSKSQLDVSSTSAERQEYEPGPLEIEVGALLFGRACRHVRNETSRKILFDKIVKGGLSPDSHLYRSIAGGNPAHIIESAQSMSDSEYVRLLSQKAET
uniref:NB-ARC domain-containing protein n=1 Tax=Odontella aurita TaxID=265563 RepID=A0A7S4J5H2_9STRA